MSGSWLQALIPAMILLLLALSARALLKSWFAPGAFFSLTWCSLVLFSLFGAPGYDVRSNGIWWILISVIVVYTGDLIGQLAGWIFCPRNTRTIEETDSLYFPVISYIILISIIAGFGSIFITLRSFGYGVYDLLSFKSLLTMSYKFSIARYYEEYVPPLLAQILLTGTYTGPLFGGLLFGTSFLRHHRILSALSLLPGILNCIIHTTRTSIFIVCILWASSYFSTRIFIERRSARLFTQTQIFTVVGIISILIPLFVVLQMARGMEEIAIGNFPERLLSLRHIFFGHLVPFSHWFQQSWQNDFIPTFGAFTFAGLHSSLGFSIRKPGLYSQSVWIEEGQESNVYTAFRGLIEDFAPEGALAALFLGGILAGGAYYRMVHGKCRILDLPILSTFYTFTLYSFIVSIFNYNSTLLAFGIFACYFIIVKLGIFNACFTKRV